MFPLKDSPWTTVGQFFFCSGGTGACRCPCYDLVRCSEHCGLGMCGPALCSAHTRFTWTLNRPKPQSGAVSWAWGALRSPSPQRRPSVAALAALGRSMGVPEVLFISGFSHYLFTELPAPRRTAAARSDDDMVCIQLCEFILLRYTRKRAQGILEFFSSPQKLSSGAPQEASFPHQQQRDV